MANHKVATVGNKILEEFAIEDGRKKIEMVKIHRERGWEKRIEKS